MNPVTRKRWLRFRSVRRAWISLWLLAVIYVISLCAECVCNSRPLVMGMNGRLYFPVARHYPADEFLGNGVSLAVDYRELEALPQFKAAGGWMVWPPFVSDPNEQVRNSELQPYRRITAYLMPVPGVATATIAPDSLTLISVSGGESLAAKADALVAGAHLDTFWELPEIVHQAIGHRFGNEPSAEMECRCIGRNGMPDVTLKLMAYKRRRQAPKRLAVKLMEVMAENAKKSQRMTFDGETLAIASGKAVFSGLSEEQRSLVEKEVCRVSALDDGIGESNMTRAYRGDGQEDGGDGAYVMAGPRLRLRCERERIEHPFRPVPGHRLGLDDSGRDVLARIIYSLRTSLTFGLILVAFSMMFGTAIGCVQGYMGGWADMLGQRAIEIWSALPFLYVIILMGSLFGTGFWLLIVCYALFNWIGVSYYMRAEMFRLRRMPFVEAARCMGMPWWLIITRHILPNALVPLVTLLPFSLVGAIGALAGLDYLGFGLPPPTPSLGQLLQQAQIQREAWWLTAYPSLALFIIMLLCVFIGEGVREAFDPKRQNRLQ